jgi:hypothetical protein
MTGETAIEIFGDRRADTRLDVPAEGLANVNALSGNA